MTSNLPQPATTPRCADSFSIQPVVAIEETVPAPTFDLINKVTCGECLEVMQSIADASIDMILCDLPYGITDCKWDSIIPLDLMWQEYKRIIKDRGAIVLTASQPFTSKLVMSNKKMFRHEWIWKKNYSTGFLNVKRLPMRSHESILVFGKQSPNYYPVMRTGFKPYNRSVKGGRKTELYARADKPTTSTSNGERYPITVIEADRDKQRLHPTQKPVPLFEYLVKTYTIEGQVVLDNCAGSGTTGVACKNLKRDFILIEQEQKYCDIANQRLAES